MDASGAPRAACSRARRLYRDLQLELGRMKNWHFLPELYVSEV